MKSLSPGPEPRRAALRLPGARTLALAALLGLSPGAVSRAADLVVDFTRANSPYPFNTVASYDNVYVGSLSNGTLNQTGGILNVTTGQLFLGANVGSTGAYNLSAGVLNTVSTDVGDSGAGTFTLTGGAHNVTGTDGNALGSLDLASYANSRGTYNLNGGTLTAGYVRGGAGTSTFNFNGGTLAAGADNASFLGSLSNATVGNGGAVIDTNGHNVSVGQALLHLSDANPADGGLTKNGAGTLTLAGASNYTGNTTVSAGTLAVTGSINSGGGALTVDGSGSTAATAATLSLSGGGSAFVASAAYIGRNGTGTVNQSGGTFTTSGNGLFLGNSLFSSGTYNLSGGSLGAGTVNVGYSGFGTFTQTGGSVTIQNGNLYVGGSVGADGANNPSGNGTYTLSGSTSSLSAALANVGFNGPGTFTQSGGSVTLSGGVVSSNNGINFIGALVLGYNSGSSGTYSLSGGNLTAGADVSVGLRGSGTFTQTGGSFSAADGTVALGDLAGGSGTYTLSGSSSSLSAAAIVVGNAGQGTFTQSGGSVATNGNGLVLGTPNGGSGTYSLSGGSLSTGRTQVSNGVNTSTFTQTGGTHTTTLLSLTGFNPASVGTYHLDGGTLQAGAVTSGGQDANGTIINGTSTFNFNGGTLRAGGSSATFFQGLTTANVRDRGAFIDTNGTTVTIAQPLVHSTVAGDAATDGGLAKSGAGTLTLTGASTYTGATQVSAGTLLANNPAGSATGSGAVSVASGATLGGNGRVAGAVTVRGGATLAPGLAGPGRLILDNSLTLNSGSTLALELGGTTAGSSGYDQTLVAGRLTLGGSLLSVTVVNGFTLAPNQTFFVLDRTGADVSVTGLFANAPGGLYTDGRGDTFQVNYAATNPADGDGRLNDVSLTVLTVVPEPATWAMLAMGGVLGWGALVRRRWGMAGSGRK